MVLICGHEHQYVALKVLSGECYYTDKDIFEREILKHLRDGKRSTAGYPFICHLLDDFEIQGPNGKHVCLVFPLMEETLRSFGAWFEGSLVPYYSMRRFTIEIALALDYAHDQGVIHTGQHISPFRCGSNKLNAIDIQPSNIFVQIRDRTLLKRYLEEEKPSHQDREVPYVYVPIPSRSLRRYYFHMSDSIDGFSVVLGDWGVASWKDGHLSEHIQPLALQAPEVLIKAAWDETTDWWNFGCVVLEVFHAIRLFSVAIIAADGTEKYSLRMHLAQMVDSFGPFPRRPLDNGDPELVASIFTNDGTIIGFTPDYKYRHLASDIVLEGLNTEEREDFASFLRFIMKLDPAERPDAEKILRHPWLDALQD